MKYLSSRKQIILGLLCLLTPLCYAEKVVMPASDHLAITASENATPSSIVLLFDLSTIPINSVVDIADLEITYDAENGSARHVDFRAFALATEWNSAETPESTEMDRIDTLWAYGTGLTGDGRTARLDVTDIVQAWHSGAIDNHGLILSHADEEGTLALNDVEGKWQATLTVHYTRALPARD